MMLRQIVLGNLVLLAITCAAIPAIAADEGVETRSVRKYKNDSYIEKPTWELKNNSFIFKSYLKDRKTDKGISGQTVLVTINTPHVQLSKTMKLPTSVPVTTQDNGKIEFKDDIQKLKDYAAKQKNHEASFGCEIKYQGVVPEHSPAGSPAMQGKDGIQIP